MPNERRLWRVWISEQAEATIVEAAEAAHPNETGGILVGVLAHGRPWVTNAVQILSPKSSGTYYEVPAGARRKQVARLRRGDSRLGYLGEWHSHPLDLPPSADQDIVTMSEIAVDPEAGCPRPVLVLARRVNDGYMLDARQWTATALRELRLLRSGPLLGREPSKRTLEHVRDAIRRTSRSKQRPR